MLFDFKEIPGKECYKLLVSTVTPRPIAWVVSQDAKGMLNAAPFSFFNVFSGDPAVVAIGIGNHKPGQAKDSRANILETGEFVVNLVSESNAEAMNITAIEFDSSVDELEQAGLTTLPSVRVKPPRIAESPVALECELMQIIDLGESGLVLGRVVAMHVRDEFVLDAAKSLHRYAEIEAARPHAWPRMVRPHIGFIRHAAHPGKRVEDENSGGVRAQRKSPPLAGIRFRALPVSPAKKSNKKVAFVSTPRLYATWRLRNMEDRIEKRIELKAPVSRVWRALTDHREFGEWFRVKLDGPFVPGQISRGQITYPGYEHVKWEAVVQKMEPERLFSFTWHPYAIDPKIDYSKETPTLVEFRLEKTASGTLLRAHRVRFRQDPQRPPPRSIPHE